MYWSSFTLFMGVMVMVPLAALVRIVPPDAPASVLPSTVLDSRMAVTRVLSEAVSSSQVFHS